MRGGLAQYLICLFISVDLLLYGSWEDLDNSVLSQHLVGPICKNPTENPEMGDHTGLGLGVTELVWEP